MFGYLQIQKSELLVRESEAYKAVYCGLCRQMGKDYSVFTRFTLSYDCTFYAMLLCRLTDIIENAAAFLYASPESVANLHFLRGLQVHLPSLKPFFSHQRKKAADKYPDMDKAVSDMMKMQYDAEHSEKPSVDMSAHPTALMLAAVLSAEAHDEIQKRVLYEFGYHIGRWIYLVDAADDIEKDIKSNGFNPFVNKKTGEVKSSDFIKAVLNQSLARAYDAYNLLNFTDFKGILDNMMLLGFPASQNRVTSKLDTEVNNE